MSKRFAAFRIALKRYGLMLQHRLTGLLEAVSFIATLCVGFIVLSLMKTQVTMQSGNAPNDIFKVVSDCVVGFMSGNVETLGTNQYLQTLTPLLQGATFIATVFFIAVPYISVSRRLRRRRKMESLKVVRLTGRGQDIEIMSRHFRNAEEIIINSGDFSWILENSNMRDLVVDMANRHKLKLISYRSRDEVKESLGDQLFNRLESSLSYAPERNIKCAVISHTTEKTFLYKVVTYNEERMCILRSDRNSQYLLEALHKMCSLNQNTGDPANQSS